MNFLDFFQLSPRERLFKNIEVEFLKRFNFILGSQLFTNKQKNILRAVLYSARFIAESLIDNIKLFQKFKKLDFNKYINPDVDAHNIFLFACHMSLSDIRNRMKNSPSFSKNLREDLDWIIDSLSTILEVDKSTYFLHFLNEEKKQQFDPRDIWFSQDTHFYKKVFRKDFDFDKYINDLDFKMAISIISNTIRIEAAKLFNDALNYKK